MTALELLGLISAVLLLVQIVAAITYVVLRPRPAPPETVPVRAAPSAAWPGLRAFHDRENGLVTRYHRTHGPQTLPGCDVAEVGAFASAWNDRVEPDALSHRLGIPYYGLEQLVAIRTLDADGLALPETGPHCRSEAVRELLHRFRENACRSSLTPFR